MLLRFLRLRPTAAEAKKEFAGITISRANIYPERP